MKNYIILILLSVSVNYAMAFENEVCETEENVPAIVSLQLKTTSGVQVSCLTPGQTYLLEFRFTGKSCGCIGEILTFPGNPPTTFLGGRCKDTLGGGTIKKLTWTIQYNGGTIQIGVYEGCCTGPSCGSASSIGQSTSLLIGQC